MVNITKKEINELKEIRDTATMENAEFYPYNKDADDEVKNITKLWRETWIIAPLDKIIKRLEKEEQK